MKTKREIKLGNDKYLVIDLTEPLKENVEVFPGDPRPKKNVFSEIKKTGYQHHIYQIGDHVFHPHGDAPKHQNLNSRNKGFEIYDLDFCFNPACLIDLSKELEAKKLKGVKYLVKVERKHLEPYSRTISKKSALLIRTGYDKWLEKNNPHQPKNIPYLTKEAAEFVKSFRGIKVFGIDSITIDPPGIHDSHQVLKDLLIVESLVHLDQIPLKSKENFDLQTSPVKILGATGGPIVAYAFIEIRS